MKPTASPATPCRRRRVHRHHDRVVRLLHLRHRRCPGVRRAVLPLRQQPVQHHGRVRYLRRWLLRPAAGGIVFGHVGDRIGRKKSLVITLLMMGIVTVGIGLLPTYAQISATAPVLLILLRIVRALPWAASGAGRC